MIHLCFNNLFIEDHQKPNVSIKENFNFPFASENDLAALSVLDLFEKAQHIFTVSKQQLVENVDMVNYIEINMRKPELTRKRFYL